MHWFNTSSLLLKQHYAIEISKKIIKFYDLVYYGFISQERLQKILTHARKCLDTEQQTRLPDVGDISKPRQSFEASITFAEELVGTAEWPFYFFGDTDDHAQYWGLSRLSQLQVLENTRQYAIKEVENIKYYRELCYYGFITPLQAEALFAQFKKAGAEVPERLAFPDHLAPKHSPVISFRQVFIYVSALAKKEDWPFYDGGHSQNVAAYWGINRYGALKHAYECSSGVGNFFGILFVAGGFAQSANTLYFEMTDMIYRNAQKKVASWCWSHRSEFALCTHTNKGSQKPLIQDKQWLNSLLFTSAELVDPNLSAVDIDNHISMAYATKMSLTDLSLIRFLENIRQSNDAILYQIEKGAKFFRQYTSFSHETRSFLQAKVTLENYFDRDGLGKPVPRV